tara:strand:+ start:1440 stop:2441 length:1002 start_codon:yes stop_codon:yes gene_type:complete
MAFLDRKEQVLDIQLTQYGKRLLAQGKLKPAFYAFYDDDIIYDLNWTGLDEEQNDSESRIKEAVRPEVQHVFSGIETKIKEQNKTIASNNSKDAKEIQNEADRDFIIAPLGTADPHSSYIPAWNINFLEGHYTGSVSQTYKTGSLELKIPQMEIDLEYTIKVGDDGEGVPEDGNTDWTAPIVEGVDDHEFFRFSDGTYHFIDDDKGNLFLRILEKNSHFLNENYDIEVFEFNEDDELRKLSFMQDEILIRDDILLDNPEKPIVKDFGPDYVEYYFDLLVDKEIDNEVYCNVIKTQTLEDAFTDEDVFKCEDVPMTDATSDIYRISKEIDEEPC